MIRTDSYKSLSSGYLYCVFLEALREYKTENVLHKWNVILMLWSVRIPNIKSTFPRRFTSVW